MALKKQKLEDLPRILQIPCICPEIYEAVRQSQAVGGDSFPPEDTAGKGYRKEQLYVVKMIPVFMECLLLSSEKEPTYEKIEQGAWISDTEYGTLHRVAGDGTIHGIFDKDRRFLRTENRTSESRYA